jgi:hypothetical protein
MNAITKIDDQSDTLPDGSLSVSAEQLALLRNGDVRKGRRELKLLLQAEKDRHVSNAVPKRPENVRIAVPTDETAILELLIMDLEENAMDVAELDIGRVVQHIQAATRKHGAIMGVIDGPNGKPVALIFLMPAQWWWSKAYYIQETITFVHPEHRRSHHIDNLLNFAKWVQHQWTTDFGYKLYLMCGVLGTKRIREKMILYRRKFQSVGMLFLYPSPPNAGG